MERYIIIQAVMRGA